MIGRTISHYKITEKLGEGGMDVVYRADDTKLERTVALKFLAAHLLNDEEAKARFLREAKAAAGLHHPNICPVHEIGEAEGRTFLSMAFIEGETLEAKIERGPLPLKEAVDIGHQVSEGLEAAHEKGVVHRDIKPANVMVDAKGRATIMDFGLARLTEASRLTKADQTMGTAAYMSPEQAQGIEVDRRTDIWALGVVLYEMVAGARPFKGEYDQALLYEIVHEEPPPLTSVRAGVPMELEFIAGKCLAKRGVDRYQHTSEIAVDLRTLGEKLRSSQSAILRTVSPGVASPTTAAASPTAKPARTWLWSGGAAVLAIVATALGFVTLRPEPETAPVRFSISLPQGQELTSAPAISRDGQIIAFTAEAGSESQLYLRYLDSFEAHTVPGASGALQPFFSPNGKWVGFFAQGRLKKVEVDGGTPIDLAEASLPFGGTWTPDDTIIYAASLGSGLLRVSASGGAHERLTQPDGAEEGYAHVFPQTLPGGDDILFAVYGRTQGGAVLSLDSGQWEMVLPSATGAAPMFESTGRATGRLLVTDQASGIRAAPFDAAHPAPTNADTSVLTDVYYHVERDARGWLDVSDNGTAVYASGNPAKTSVVWVNREGATEALDPAQGVYREVALSPDGTRAVVRQARDLWIHDLRRGTRSPLTRASVSNFNLFPLWSPDGEEVIFGSNRSGNWDLYTKPADSSRPADVLLSRPYDQHPSAVLADGTVLYFEMRPETGWDLWSLSPGGPSQQATASPFRVTAFNEMDAQMSPARDGGPRWIAYTSDESGRNEIYAESYPNGEKRMAVSTNGGFSAKWSRDGRELFYTSREAVFSVPVRSDGSLGASRRLFDWKRQETDRHFRSYDLSLDGERFLMIRRDPGSMPRQLNVILNWSDER